MRAPPHSRALVDQTERASQSVPLNIAEGSLARGGNRVARYSTALAEANETRACLQTALSARYIADIDPEVHALLRKIIGTLYRNVN